MSQDDSLETRSKNLIAVLSALTALFGLSTAVLGSCAKSATNDRDSAQVRVATLEKERNELRESIGSLERQLDGAREKAAGLSRDNATLQSENDNLKAQLGAGGGTDESASNVIHYRYTVPLHDSSYDYAELHLDGGTVNNEYYGDIRYHRNSKTERPEFVSEKENYSIRLAKSLIDAPTSVTRKDCEEAVNRNPSIHPVSQLRKGTLICVRSEGGMSLLRISAAPNRRGDVRVVQTYWPD